MPVKPFSPTADTFRSISGSFSSLPSVILLIAPSFSKTRISFEPRKLMAVGKSMPSTISSALSSGLSNVSFAFESFSKVPPTEE